MPRRHHGEIHYGLQQLYPPDNVEHETTIDIIAIHGLDTSAPETWEFKERDAKGQTTAPPVNWLKDPCMLPAAVPMARVLVYNWRADVFKRAVGMTLTHHADDLLLAIRTMRQQDDPQEKRPIVFIASCFGGLVVAQALNFAASASSPYSFVRLATVGVVFLGTPFRGTPLERKAQWLVAYEGFIGEDASRELINDLDDKTRVLNGIAEQFARNSRAEDYYLPVHCFYETQKTNLATKLLPKSLANIFKYNEEIVSMESACLFGFDNNALHVPHVMLNKFNHNDPNFRTVAGVIQRHVNAASCRLAARKMGQLSSTVVEEGDQLNKWLSTVPYVQYHNEMSTGLVDNSGAWLFSKHEYQDWRQSDDSSILWLHGIPGCGKSRLVSTLINHLRAESGMPVVFYYCAREADERQRGDASQIMRCIAKQISISNSRIREILMQTLRRKVSDAKSQGNDVMENRLTINECEDILLKHLKWASATLIIDAVDELDGESLDKLLSSLTRITAQAASTKPVKIFISSRNENHIKRRLGSPSEILVRDTDNIDDIRRFVNLKVEDSIKNGRLLSGEVPPEFKRKLINTLIEKSQGMFQWVSLQIGMICGPHSMMTRSDIEKHLREPPQTLRESYKLICDRINQLSDESRSIAERTLKWLLCAQRTLRASELLAAISGESGERYSESDVLDRCFSLVDLDHEFQVFRFSHLSVREYFELYTESRRSTAQDDATEHLALAGDNSPARWDVMAAHAMAAETCLQVLMTNGKRTYTGLPDGNEFYVYSMVHWVGHCQRSGVLLHENKTLKALLARFLTQNNGEASRVFVEWNWAIVAATEHGNRDYEDIQNGLRSITSFPADPLFAVCVVGAHGIIDTSPRFRQPATMLGRVRKLIRELSGLERMICNNRRGESYLQVACRHGHYGIVKLLLDNGAVASPVAFNPPIYEAAKGGHEAVVELLLDKGCDVGPADAKWWGPRSPLVAASEQGHEEVVQLLLDRGADVNSMTWTPLPYHAHGSASALATASEKGQYGVVKLLLERGAAVNTTTLDFVNPLVIASQNGHHRVVEILLRYGANVNGQNACYKYWKNSVEHTNALVEASKNGHKEVVRCLVQHRADVNARGGSQGSALESALLYRHHGIARLLVEAGARPNPGKDIDIAVDEEADETEPLLGVPDTGQSATNRGYDIKSIQASKRGKWTTYSPEDNLRTAAMRGDEKSVRKLLDHGVDPNDPKALASAAGNGEVEILKLLLDQGADVNLEMEYKVNGLGEYSVNILQTAAAEGQDEVAHLLLQRRAFPDVHGGTFGTALAAAAKGGYETVVRLLLKYNANVNGAAGKYGDALQAAACAGNDQVVRLLLERGADVNAQNKPYGNALQAAIVHKQEYIAMMLLKAGARRRSAFHSYLLFIGRAPIPFAFVCALINGPLFAGLALLFNRIFSGNWDMRLEVFVAILLWFMLQSFGMSLYRAVNARSRNRMVSSLELYNDLADSMKEKLEPPFFETS